MQNQAPPIAARVMRDATAAGSAATTLRGAVRYLRANRPHEARTPIGRGSRYYPASYRRASWVCRARRFSDAQRAAGRYCDDATYAAYYLTVPATTLEWPQWVAARVALPHGLVPPLPMLGIQALDIDARTAEALGVKVCQRGADWHIIGGNSPSWVDHVDGETEWINGAPKHYTRATNTTHVRTTACIVGRSLLALLHHTHVRLPAPEGYRWDADRNGIRLVSRVDRDADLHVDAGHALRAHREGMAGLVAELIANAQTRAAERTRKTIEAEAERHAWVSRADSLRAGNCSVGTDRWISEHGLDQQRHYPVRAIRAIATDARARLALSAAVQRHVDEMVAGVCAIAA